jgi:hypothetical protein
LTTKNSVLVTIIALAALYVIGQVALLISGPKQDPYADDLSMAGTELILLDRGRVLSKDQLFRSWECLVTKCDASPKDFQIPYMAALSYARAKYILPGSGEVTCSDWIFEPWWRNGCIDLTIKADQMTPQELQLLLDFVQHPCRYANAAITTSLRRFHCRNGVADQERKMTVFLWRQPLSANYEHPEKISLTTH